jgi:hypothetical protein
MPTTGSGLDGGAIPGSAAEVPASAAEMLPTPGLAAVDVAVAQGSTTAPPANTSGNVSVAAVSNPDGAGTTGAAAIGGANEEATYTVEEIHRRLAAVRAGTEAAVSASTAAAVVAEQADEAIGEEELTALKRRRDELRRTVQTENTRLKCLIDQLRVLHRDVAIMIDASAGGMLPVVPP